MSPVKEILSYLQITLGSSLFAFGLNYFIIANGLAEGGLTGVSLIIHYLTGWSVAVILFVLNIPILLLGLKRWGSSFIIKTLWSITAISLALHVTRHYSLLTHDLLLAALYGGAISGLGIGLVLRAGATTGGIDIIARLIHEKRNISIGEVFFVFDAAVLSLVALFFGLEKALYTLVGLFIFSRVVDFMIEGINEAKAVIIISEASAAITQQIITRMQRGATLIKGFGGYTGLEKDLLYVVLSRQQVLMLKEIVEELDPDAFVIVSDVHEVMGEGFYRTL